MLPLRQTKSEYKAKEHLIETKNKAKTVKNKKKTENYTMSI